MKSRKGRRGTILLIIVALLLPACRINLPATATPDATRQSEQTVEQTVEQTATPAHTPTPMVVVVTATPDSPVVTHIVPRTVSGKLLLETAQTVLTARLEGRDKAGDRMAGDLRMEKLTTDGLRQTSTVMTGSLTTRVLSYLTKNDSPNKHIQSAVYRLVSGAYWMLQYAPAGDFSCAKLDDPDTEDPNRRQTPFEALLQVRQQFMYGKLVGEDEVNGIPVKHYTLDPSASNSAALESKDPQVHNSATALKLLGGEVSLASEGDYLVSFSADYEGSVAELDFSGTLRMEFDLTRPSGVTELTLPPTCVGAEARANLPATAGKAELLTLWSYYNNSEAGLLKTTLTLGLRGKRPNGRTISDGITVQYTEDLSEQRQMMVVDGLNLPRLASAPELDDVATGRVSLYTIGDASYVLAEGQNARNNRCAGISAEDGHEIMDTFLPDNLMWWFIDLGTLYGVCVRDEKVNGIATRHYRLDVNASNDAAAKGKTMDYVIPALTSGDVYLAADGDYLVRLTAEASGELEDFDFSGRTTVRFDLLTPTRGVNIALPKICIDARPS